MNDQMKYTFCNPLPIPDIPRGKDDWYDKEPAMFSHENRPAEVDQPEYRTISDPTVMYYDNKWYLYPSYGMAWVTEDFQHWKFKRTDPYCPKYSPAITPWKNGFLMTSWNCPLYYSDDPMGPFQLLGNFLMPDGKEFVPCDPGIFTDDDGRIYLYAHNSTGTIGQDDFVAFVEGYELDRENPRQVVDGPYVIVRMHPEKYPWERDGFNRQNIYFGWIEGPHLVKANGRYYMIYATPDTGNGGYCNAVYYSDESPLKGFVCQKKNPLTEKRYGIVNGPGHGCVEHGPNGTLWAFYTIPTARRHKFERRIGMDLVCIDENGELYCPHGVTDTPQYIPGYIPDAETCNEPGLYNLTDYGRGEASSCAPGREAFFANDTNTLSCWVPDPADPNPTLTVPFRSNYDVCASRIFWTEMNYDPKVGLNAGPIGYVIEGCYNGQWTTLIDCTDQNEDLNVDYRTFETKKCKSVRVRITKKPAGIEVGIVDFSVFGTRSALEMEQQP